MPTLIIADYAMEKARLVGRLAAQLSPRARQGLPPIRLLLLDRQADRLFEDAFLGSSQSEKGVIQAARYAKDKLALPDLVDSDVWALVEPCPWRDDAPAWMPPREFFSRLTEIDRDRRVLVAMILADMAAAAPPKPGSTRWRKSCASCSTVTGCIIGPDRSVRLASSRKAWRSRSGASRPTW